MEDWLDFDYRQMSEVQNPMMNPIGTYPPPLMTPGPMMPCGQPTMSPNPLSAPPASVPTAPSNIPIQDNTNYLQGYLKKQIGKNVRVDFLIGTGILTDRTGKLVSVGIDYVILNPVGSNDLEVCDLYSIKFVEVFGAAGTSSKLQAK